MRQKKSKLSREIELDPCSRFLRKIIIKFSKFAQKQKEIITEQNDKFFSESYFETCSKSDTIVDKKKEDGNINNSFYANRIKNNKIEEIRELRKKIKEYEIENKNLKQEVHFLKERLNHK